jgi:GTP cyclohydrolase IA
MGQRQSTLKQVEDLFQQFFGLLIPEDGDNPEVDLSRTPARIARMYVEELLSGYDTRELGLLRQRFTVFNKARRHELVVIQGVPFYSLCAHHMVPFFGTASMGYLPAQKVIGLSKFPRVVKLFSRRLQTQENLTGMIADFIQAEANPAALIVHLRATHLCCAARGIERPGVEMVTSAIRPVDFPTHLKTEFYSLMTAR